MSFTIAPNSDLKKLLDPNLTNFISMVTRPMFVAFSFGLEHTYFHPDDLTLNDFFQFRLLKWQDMEWAIITIPSTHHIFADVIAKRTGLKLTNGSPCILGWDNTKNQPTQEFFPLEGPNVFSLECDPTNKLLTNENLNNQEETQKLQNKMIKEFFYENNHKYKNKMKQREDALDKILSPPTYEEIYGENE